MAAMQNPSIGSPDAVTSFHSSMTTESINAERSRMAAFPSPVSSKLFLNSRGFVRVQFLQRGSATFELHIRRTRPRPALRDCNELAKNAGLNNSRPPFRSSGTGASG